MFLKDQHKKLINAQEGKTKALRQLRFNTYEEVDYELVKEYVTEAIQNQNDGKEIKRDKKKLLIIPDELKVKFELDQELKCHYEALTLSKQREYAEYISEAIRYETKLKRLKTVA